MSAVFDYVRVTAASRLLGLADVDRIAVSLRAGELAVLPTETGYMLAALATSPVAVKSVFAVKGRNPAHVMHVACSSLDMARRFAIIDDRAAALIGAFTPGPLSVVLPQTDELPSDLVTLNGTVGIRVPDAPATLQVIAAVGAPLTATSLNPSGQRGAWIEPEQLAQLAWPDRTRVTVVTDPKSIAYAQPSTLVRLIGSAPEILRPGPVAEAAIRAALGA